MKKIIILFLFISNIFHAQIDSQRISKIIRRSANICIDGFFWNDSLLPRIPMKNIIFRPISINSTMDTIVYSLELNTTPNVLEKINIAGFSPIGKERLLFIQEAHLSEDFSCIPWVISQDIIKYTIDSLRKSTTLLSWEPHPLVVYAVTYIDKRTYTGYTEAEYYLQRDFMIPKYYPVDRYPEDIEVDIYKHEISPYFYSLLPLEFQNMTSFRRYHIFEYD